MGIADNSEKTLLKQRAFLKRRSTQFNQSPLQNNWSLCTDQQRQWRRRRLRRLLPVGKRNGKRKNRDYKSDLKKQNTGFFWHIILPMFAVLSIGVSFILYNNGDIVSNFMQRYSSQYRAIFHNNLNYCNRSLSLPLLFERLHENVLNQEVALTKLQRAMDNDSSLQSIALVGSSGVGKSLTLRLLQDTYPWVENVHYFSWNDYQHIEGQGRFQVLSKMFQKISHCGRNLFIIDNIGAQDTQDVTYINKLLTSCDNLNNESSDLTRNLVTIFYVFNMNRMLSNDLYEKQLNVVHNLKDIEIIDYRGFNDTDLEKCIRHELYMAGIKMEERYVSEIIKSSDVKISGCKTVLAKILVHGKPMDDEEDFQDNIEHKLPSLKELLNNIF